ncbi:uncharacterized protein LOC101950806 isoform X3 [Chrysemys picta bellii]|uniref:uncharacterized protein LOC101950806 isoform X3 n=1 Tax=Chrysemys picta bellii TaxID=8478 RepID=UPI0032B1DB2F
MERAERELLETLAMLGERELQRFKDKLREIQPKEGYQQLPSGSLRNADPPALTDLLLLFYGTDYGAEVAAEALRAIGQGALAERIERLIDALEREKYYFEWQQKQEKELKQLRYVRTPLLPRKKTLNDEQYQTIRAEKTSQEKMRKLYELMPSWDEWQKDRLYQALKETNGDLVEELEGGHFVDLHREQLIQRVSEMDRVLKLLRGHTLTPEQYQSISTGRSNVEKMQKLYELVPSWGREHKDRLYRVLWRTNRALVDEFAGVGTRAQKPSTSTSPGAKREHFVERHREQLIQCASSVDRILGVLRWSHYTLDAMPPSVGLETTNKSLPEEPEALKRRTGSGGLLRNWLYILNDEQYQTIRAEKTSQEQMRKLYELVPGWDKLQKYRLYQALMETNGDLVEELEGVDTRAQKPSTSTSPGAKREHFVERHREQLIQRASLVDRILGVLRRSHYTLDAMPPFVGLKRTNKRLPEEPEGHSGHMDFPHDEIDFEELISASGFTSEETESHSSSDAEIKAARGAGRGTGRELSVDSQDDPTTSGCRRFPPLPHGVSTRAQKPSTSTSPGATQEHFVERHREQLIQRASSVDTILGVLRRSHYPLDAMPPSVGLETTNKSLPEEPEGTRWRIWNHWRLPPFFKVPFKSSKRRTGRGELLRNQLYILNDEQYQTIRAEKTSQEKMRKLYELVPGWDEWHKDRLYQALMETNRDLVEELKVFSMLSGACRGTGRELSVDSRDNPTTAGTSCLPPVQHDSMRNQGPVSYASKAHTVFPGEGSQVTGQAHHSLAPTGHSGHMEVLHDQISAEELTSASGFTSEETESHSSSAAGIKAARGETSRSQSPTACLRGQHKCNWCSREEEEDLPEEIKPEIIQDVDGNQEMYRVHFSRAGWFRCPETELEFEVRAAVTIRYGYGSWRQHLTESQQEQWMVAGPLFDIRVEPTEAVAAIHLPHFLCLRDADKSWMHIAHFIDEGMILENPTQVKLFHAVLENPSFSPIGVFWRRESSDQRTPIHSIVLLYQAQKRVNLTLHLYLIPDDGSRVKELPFLDKPADALQPFTEIHTKDVKEELELSLVEKNDEKPIWEAVIRPEDLMPSVSSTKMRTDTHFVDQHREQLIQRVTAVDGILDSLHGPVLDTEQYQRVRAERTNPDKMRKLYELVPSWNSDCKDKLYQALKDKHSHLVEELSGNR